MLINAFRNEKEYNQCKWIFNAIENNEPILFNFASKKSYFHFHFFFIIGT